MFSFLFGGAVIYWQWEAMVTSYLSARVTTLPFYDMKGLVEKSDFKIAVTPGKIWSMKASLFQKNKMGYLTLSEQVQHFNCQIGISTQKKDSRIKFAKQVFKPIISGKQVKKGLKNTKMP